MTPTPRDPFLPEPAVIRRVEPEMPGTRTYYLDFADAGRHADYTCRPGQFNMLYVPGVGEVPISVSSAAGEGPQIAHTIRFVGTVTNVIERLQPGDVIGLRGPYGAGWPLERTDGKDVLVVAGGLGLAPLRPAVRALVEMRKGLRNPDDGAPGSNRSDFALHPAHSAFPIPRRVILLYGARTPADLLYAGQYSGWEQEGLELHVTVDRADAAWTGTVGVVPSLMNRLELDPERTVVFTCGPEIMMRFAILEALSRGVPADDVFLSIELNMQCAVGLCGRCQLGPYFVCKDGPVFAYRRVEPFLRVERF